eukprot:1970883-Prymnesium_polylepis.1
MWSARYDRIHQTIDDPKEAEENHVPSGNGEGDEDDDEFKLDRNLLLLRTTNGNAVDELDENDFASPRLADDDTLASPRLSDSPPHSQEAGPAARHNGCVNEGLGAT